MFADDTTIYYFGKEVEEIIDALNHILNNFRVWCCRNHLTVHTGKTVAILISNHALVAPLRLLMFGNSYIHFTTNPTYLGVEKVQSPSLKCLGKNIFQRDCPKHHLLHRYLGMLLTIYILNFGTFAPESSQTSLPTP